MDFTRYTYYNLLKSLEEKYTNFLTLSDYVKLENKNISVCILRHDVDLNPQNSLKIAEIENSLNIRGSYYFRIIPNSYNLDIMKKIQSLNHEIGYHYEDVDLVLKKSKIKFRNKEKLIDKAYDNFCTNLKFFRKDFIIDSICMHGSPLSKYDNRIIWEKYNYKELDIIAEPYFDINFSEFLYLTDTGRRWDGDSVSVRDKVESNFNNSYSTTNDIILDAKNLPNKIMLTIHPQRWHDNKLLWLKELIFQKIKNNIKRLFFVKKNHE